MFWLEIFKCIHFEIDARKMNGSLENLYNFIPSLEEIYFFQFYSLLIKILVYWLKIPWKFWIRNFSNFFFKHRIEIFEKNFFLEKIFFKNETNFIFVHIFM